MNETLKLRIVLEASEKLLDLIEHRDGYTTSDIQGTVDAIVLNIINMTLTITK